MPSQQAEKDAVDTLLFMSSPNNSSYLAHTSAVNSTAHPSPLRFEFPTVKRVVFEERSESSESNGTRIATRSSSEPEKRARYGYAIHTGRPSGLGSTEEVQVEPSQVR